MEPPPVNVNDPAFTHINASVLEIRKSSAQGWGWFAKVDIPENGWLWKNTHEDDIIIYKYDDLITLPENMRHQLFQFTDDSYELVSREDPNYYQNHSCDGNTWFQGDDSLVARREIKRGEEITIDYATFDSHYPFDTIDQCMCGSQFCRGKVTPDDWKREDVQKRYHGHFLTYLQKKIDNIQK